MHFKMGAEVFTADGTKVGRIKSVVMSPKTHEVTGLVVERGFLFTEEKVLPFNWVSRVEQDNKVVLTEVKHAFDNLPPFEETLYIPRQEVEANHPDNVNTPAYYPYGSPGYYPDYFVSGLVTTAPLFDDPDYVKAEVENIADDHVAVQTGAAVYGSDDRHVGNVEEVFASASGSIEHLLVSKGIFFQTRKLIPMAWVYTTGQNEVHLSVTNDMLERLPDYDSHEWREREIR